MFMKQHILAALREQATRWEELLTSLSDEQITTAEFNDNWSIKDVVSHLWSWQQISIVRIEAALRDQEPQLPTWTATLPADWEECATQTNASMYERFHHTPWSAIHEQWYQGYDHFLKAAEGVAEKDLLDGGRYPWLEGKPLALILLASYDHHQEHLEKLLAWLEEQGAIQVVRK